MTGPASLSGPNPGGPTTPTPPGQGPLNAQNLVDPSQIGTSGSNTNTSNLSQSTLNSLIQPPPMKTFIYAPAVRIVIAHNEIEYDVSADVVRCSLTRPENSAATLFFTLHNKGLRYTPSGSLSPFFSRMDRVIVYMKKTSWIQVFSGYLDTVPYRQLYAGPVQFKATCTIKRLMHTWWDPALPACATYLNQMGANVSVGDGLGQADSGLGTMIQNIISNIGGWNIANIHIQNFPTSFLQFLTTMVAQLQQSNAPAADTFTQLLLGSNTSPGPGAYAGYNANAGNPGPTAPSGAAAAGAGAFYVTQIIAACDAKGLGPLVTDNTLSAALIQAGATGETGTNAMQNPGTQKAWQQIQSTGQQMQQANRSSDGAILAVACALVETQLRNVFNPSVSGSESFPNDGPSTAGGDGMGLFLQNTSWGTIAQCMNPQQAAGMFFAALQNVSGWRQMDPGQAIAQAENSDTASVALFDAQITLATSMVQAARTSQTGTASTVIPSGSMTLGGTSVPAAASSVGALAGGAGGAVSAGSNLVTGAASSSPAPAALASAVNPTQTVQPVPNSEGAINFMTTCLGLPYVWGGTGPAGYDCSGLMQAGFKSIGVAIPRTTQAIAQGVPTVPASAVQRGDMVLPTSGHVVMWLGNGTVLQAQQQGVPIGIFPASVVGPPSSWYAVCRACANGGVNPSAPFNPPALMGPGTPPAALAQTGGVQGAGSDGSQEGVARNLFSYLFTPDAFASTTAGEFTGLKAFIEGQPLIQMVQALCSASLRCWSSAPNGDFMAWYPDYWGIDGKPAVMLLADIEMKDCNINLSDDPLTTHVYINGDFSMTGALDDPTTGWLMTAGVATVEQPWLYTRLLTVAPGDLLQSVSGQQIMKTFGIRPLQQSYAMAGDTTLEFLLACQVFMEQWAKQYQTTIAMTFMPELFPGMRVEMPDRNLQVYVNAVSHTCDYEQGFYTSVTISAPSTPQARASLLSTTTASQTNNPIQPDQITFNQGANDVVSAPGAGPLSS